MPPLAVLAEREMLAVEHLNLYAYIAEWLHLVGVFYQFCVCSLLFLIYGVALYEETVAHMLEVAKDILSQAAVLHITELCD